MASMKTTAKSEAAYSQYERMGPDRSLAKLADLLGQNAGKARVRIATLEAWSSASHWVARAAAYDAAQREAERAARERDDARRKAAKLAREIKREAEREKMDDTRAALMQGLWVDVYQAVKKRIKGDEIKGLIGLTSLLKYTGDEERLSRGGPTSITETQFSLPPVIEVRLTTAPPEEPDDPYEDQGDPVQPMMQEEPPALPVGGVIYQQYVGGEDDDA